MDCAVCERPLPAQPRGRPRKYHAGWCTQEARRRRDGVQHPHGGPCRLCGGGGFQPGQRYFCKPDCAARYDAIVRAERDMWRALDAARLAAPQTDSSPAGAGELYEGMTEAAIRWRRDRRARLARLSRPVGSAPAGTPPRPALRT